MQKLLYITARPHQDNAAAAPLTRHFTAERLALCPVAENCQCESSSLGSAFLRTFSLRCRQTFSGSITLHGAALANLRGILLEGDYDVVFLEGEELRLLAREVGKTLLTAKIVLRSHHKPGPSLARLPRTGCLHLQGDEAPQALLSQIENYHPNNLRLALVVNRFWPEIGGAENNLYFQARELAKQFDVTVFCPRRSLKSPAREETAGFKIVRLTDWRNPFPKVLNRNNATLCPGLLWHLVTGGFHLVHCFPALNHNNMLACLAAMLIRAGRVLVTFDLLDYSPMLRNRQPGQDLLEGYRPSPWRRFFFKQFHQLFAISNRETAFLRQFNPYATYSPVPVDPDEYDKAVPSPRPGYGIADTDFVYLMLGRVSHTKGQDLGVAAFAQIAQEMPDARLVMVGRNDYEPEMLKTIRATVKKSGLEDQVTQTGMVDRDEALGWLRYADLHVVPVRFMNSGAVVVESWISGTPVIQSDAVDPNLVEDGKNGYLFPSENVNALADAMRRAYQERSTLPRMAAAGEDMVRSHYTYPHLIGQYSGVYRRILNRHNQPPSLPARDFIPQEAAV